mmetsp:Transcript_32347/g.64088  ORF Transcript_32347/g.64088 Transcript_32347/m.64088 type:complete len:211 (-) Transcript_32347:141-773(-)
MREGGGGIRGRWGIGYCVGADAVRGPDGGGRVGRKGGGPGCHCDSPLPGDHKGAVESHPKLPYNPLGVAPFFQRRKERFAPGMGDGPEIVLHLLPRHARAAVRYRQGLRLGISIHVDLQRTFDGRRGTGGGGVKPHSLARVGGVRYQLPQKHLFVGIEAMNHQIEELPCLGTELFGRRRRFGRRRIGGCGGEPSALRNHIFAGGGGATRG